MKVKISVFLLIILSPRDLKRTAVILTWSATTGVNLRQPQKKRTTKKVLKRKKQQDLGKALALFARAKEKADRLSDDHPSPTNGKSKAVSPEKGARMRMVQEDAHGDRIEASTCSSDRLKKIKACHARELAELAVLEDKANALCTFIASTS